MTITVLLADDNPVFLESVWGLLYVLPNTKIIAAARDGEEALAKAWQLKPDLLLLDIAMPKLNGLEVARAMQSWPRAPRIIFLSMNDGEAYRAAARDLGAFGFVAKSDFVAGLIPLIERLVADESGNGETLQ